MIDIKTLDHEAWCDCINNISEHCNCNLSYPIELVQDAQTKIAELEAQIKSARECIEFYGDKNNWDQRSINERSEVNIFNCEKDDEFIMGSGWRCGKRARQWLEQNKEKSE